MHAYSPTPVPPSPAALVGHAAEGANPGAEVVVRCHETASRVAVCGVGVILHHENVRCALAVLEPDRGDWRLRRWSRLATCPPLAQPSHMGRAKAV